MAKISGNPIGSVREEEVSVFVQNLATDWKLQEATLNKPKWWQFWKKTNILQEATQFMLHSIDLLIRHVEGLIPGGPDKKATVLASINELYDLIIKDLIPIWLRPVASGVKQLMMTIIIPLLIDFLVNKYKTVWNVLDQATNPKTDEVANGENTPQPQM